MKALFYDFSLLMFCQSHPPKQILLLDLIKNISSDILDPFSFVLNCNYNQNHLQNEALHCEFDFPESNFYHPPPPHLLKISLPLEESVKKDHLMPAKYDTNLYQFDPHPANLNPIRRRGVALQLNPRHFDKCLKGIESSVSEMNELRLT